MTDGQLARSLAELARLEQRARASWQQADAGGESEEADAALLVVRRTVPVMRAIEQWLALRAATTPT